MKRRKEPDAKQNPADPVEPAGTVAESVDVIDDVVAVALERAESLAAAGNHIEAAEAYIVVASTHPDDVRPLLGAATALGALARYDAAEKELRKALKLAPEQADVHHMLGATLYRKGVYAAAASTLRQAIELDDQHATAYLMLGEALNQMGEPDQAIEALEQAARLSPTTARAYYAMGIAYDRKGLPDRAAEMYRLSREAGSR